MILLAEAPGVIASEMFDRFAGDALRDQVTSIVPVGRVGASEEIAGAVLYLCSDDAKFTVGDLVGSRWGLYRAIDWKTRS